MTYIAIKPEKWIGESVPDGQCVAYVKLAANAPQTASWKRGELVKGNTAIQRGTAIATFDADGKYGNHTDGSSHAAVYLSQNTDGLTVLDQWMNVHTDPATHTVTKTPQPVHQRLIRFGPAGAKAVNDGNRYYVIE